MRRRLILLLLISASVPNLCDAQAIHPGKTGADLREALRASFTPTTYLNYSNARTMMFSVVDNNGSNKVELAYTSELFPINPARPIPDGNVVNTEHTWPQSQFSHDDAPGMKTDIHHLFPSRNRPNASRGNHPFAEIDDLTATTFWNGATPRTTPPPASEIDKFSKFKNNTFEPEKDQKGNTARALIYFFAIYEENPKVNRSFFLPQAAVVKKWHAEDPVDAVEAERSHRIEQIQGNPNPFVLDPTLVDRVLSDILPATGTPVAGPATPPAPAPVPVSNATTTDSTVPLSVIAILPNPDGADEGKETVTLANSTPADFPLAGWKLADKVNRTFPLTGSIPAGSTQSFRLTNTDMVLGNNGGEVSLINPAGDVVATVTYTAAQVRPGAFILFGN